MDQEEKHKKSPFYIQLLKGLNIMAALLLAVAYLAYYVNPADFWQPAFAGLFYPYLLAANIMFVILWIALRKKFILLSLILIAAGWNFTGRTFRFIGMGLTAQTEAIKVMSYNVRSFYSLDENIQEGARDSLMDFIAREQPEILCMQEFPLRPQQVFNQLEILSECTGCSYYFFSKYFTASRIVSGLTILSRHPLITSKTITYDGKTIAIYSDVKIGSDTIRVFNVHLASVYLSHKDYLFISDIQRPKTDSLTSRNLRKVAMKLKTGFITRGLQTHFINIHISSSPYPVIICGDLNDTPNSYTYHAVASNLDDAFAGSGQGFGHTYTSEILPSFRLDYILFTPAGFSAYGYTTHRIRLSDHYPISASLVRKQKR